jgi:hypothetical protein
VVLAVGLRSMFRCNRITILSFRLFLVGVAFLAAAGCQTDLTPLPAGSNVHVEPGQGLLIVETSSNSNIELLRLAESPRSQVKRTLKNLPEGHHVHLVVLPEGNYRWDRIELPGWTYNNRSYPVRWDLPKEEQWQVSVKAGQVNYPGMIVLHRSAWSYLSYRVLNRSGELLKSIEEVFPGLLAQYVFRYGGPGRDDFLEHYVETMRSRSPATAAPNEEAPVAPGDF